MNQGYGPPQEPTSTPDQVGGTVTPQYTGSDHNFTLQTIMDLQRSTGHLSSTVNSLKETIEKQDAKLTKIEDCVSGVTQKIYAAGVVLAILVVIGGFIVNKSWDMMVSQITAQNQAVPTQQAPKTKP